MASHSESIILLPLSVLDTQAESVSSQLRKSSCPPYRYSWFFIFFIFLNLGPGQSHESVSKWVKLKGTAGLFFQPLFQTVSADVAFLWVNRDMIPATSCVSCTCTGIKSVADRRRCFAKGFFSSFFLFFSVKTTTLKLLNGIHTERLRRRERERDRLTDRETDRQRTQTHHFTRTVV